MAAVAGRKKTFMSPLKKTAAAARTATILGVSFRPRAKLIIALEAQCTMSLKLSLNGETPFSTHFSVAPTSTPGSTQVTVAARRPLEAGVQHTFSLNSRHRQYPERAPSSAVPPLYITVITARAARGLTIRGKIIFEPSEPQSIPEGPKATRAAPHTAPTIAWVVETGIPALVASTSHMVTPAAMATEKAAVGFACSDTMPEVKTLRRPEAMKKAAIPPAAVHTVPHRS